MWNASFGSFCMTLPILHTAQINLSSSSCLQTSNCNFYDVPRHSAALIYPTDPSFVTAAALCILSHSSPGSGAFYCTAVTHLHVSDISTTSDYKFLKGTKDSLFSFPLLQSAQSLQKSHITTAYDPTYSSGNHLFLFGNQLAIFWLKEFPFKENSVNRENSTY